MASTSKLDMDRSAIVNLEAVASDDSDYEMDFSSDLPKDRTDQLDDQTLSVKSSSDNGDIEGDLTKGMATYVWQEGQHRARKAFSLYANIDILRPYYDVEPHEVRNRLILSLIPSFQNQKPKIPQELYGPTMMVLTLIALLLFQMKAYQITVQEGTLMGSAFVTCFGYWFGISWFLWLVTFICNVRVTIVQLLNLLGYGLFGHCIVISLTVVIHPNHSHLFFYVIWIIFGGLSSLRMASMLMSLTTGKSQKLVVAGIVICLHLFFLFYLHFAYHHVVEDLSEAFAAPQVHSHINPEASLQTNVRNSLPEDINAMSHTAQESVTRFAKHPQKNRSFGRGLAEAAWNKVLQR